MGMCAVCLRLLAVILMLIGEWSGGLGLAAEAVYGDSAAPAQLGAHDYCIVGAGFAGVQLAHFMEDAGRSYVLLERGEAPGSFFRKFPRHRNLISINKRHTGRGGPGSSPRLLVSTNSNFKSNS